MFSKMFSVFQCIFFTCLGPLTTNFFQLLGNVFIRVWNTENILENMKLTLGVFPIYLGFRHPRVARHVGLWHDVTRITQVHTVPVITIATTNASQVWTGTLGAPQKWVLPHIFTGDRVGPVTLGFRAERTHHLSVTNVAAFADINISAFQL